MKNNKNNKNNKLLVGTIKDMIDKSSKEVDGVIVGGLNGLSEVRVDIVSKTTKEVLEVYQANSARYNEELDELTIALYDGYDVLFESDIEDLIDNDEINDNTIVGVEIYSNDIDLVATYNMSYVFYDKVFDEVAFVVEV